MIRYIGEFLSGSMSFVELMVYIGSMVFVVFCAAPLHEFAHALAADKLGDKTARFQGRLTINPKMHIDPIGAIMIFLCGYGYARPVPVHMGNFKKPKAGMAIVALAGPVSNLIQAFICLVIYYLICVINTGNGLFLDYCAIFFSFAAHINVNLAVFNLLPLPPLDGSRIATAFLPDKYYYKLMAYERYITIALFLLLLTDVLDTPLAYASGYVLYGLQFIASLPFRLIFG